MSTTTKQFDVGVQLGKPIGVLRTTGESMMMLTRNTSVGPDLVLDTICQFKAALEKQGMECLPTNESSTGGHARL